MAFTKGKSGNPAGRPKKDVVRIFRKVFDDAYLESVLTELRELSRDNPEALFSLIPYILPKPRPVVVDDLQRQEMTAKIELYKAQKLRIDAELTELKEIKAMLLEMQHAVK